MKVIRNAAGLSRILKFEDLDEGVVYQDVEDGEDYYMVVKRSDIGFSGLLELGSGIVYESSGWVARARYAEVNAELHVGD